MGVCLSASIFSSLLAGILTNNIPHHSLMQTTNMTNVILCLLPLRRRYCGMSGKRLRGRVVEGMAHLLGHEEIPSVPDTPSTSNDTDAKTLYPYLYKRYARPICYSSRFRPCSRTRTQRHSSRSSRMGSTNNGTSLSSAPHTTANCVSLSGLTNTSQPKAETEDDGDVNMDRLRMRRLCLRHLDDMASNHSVLEEGLGSYPTPHPLLTSKSMRTLI